MTVKAIVIKRDKIIIEQTVDGLREMQSIVEGYIEAVRLKDGSTMWVNKEYRFQFGLGDFNPIASDVAGLGGRQDLMLSGILGDVFITGPPDSEGGETDVTDQARLWVRRVAHEARGVWL
jgi:hypothetical protein